MTVYTVTAEEDGLPLTGCGRAREEWEKTYALPSAFAPFAHIVAQRVK